MLTDKSISRQRKHQIRTGYKNTGRKGREEKYEDMDLCRKCDQKATVLHHKDGNNKNDAKSNLEPLCNDCHIREHVRMREESKVVLEKPIVQETVRRVSLRQFQLNTNTEIKKGLPIALTTHGHIVAYVSDHSPEKDQQIIHETIHQVEQPLDELREMVIGLKHQQYQERKPLQLVVCDIHHVYTKTCGCDRKRKGGEKK